MHKFLFKLAALASMPLSSAMAQDISYSKDIRPILDKKCVACHACYDSPCQMNMTSRFGVERGAARIDPYEIRMQDAPIAPYSNTSMSIADFRKLGFFSVTEGGKESIMAKMLRQGHDQKYRWKDGENIPEKINVNLMTRKITAANKDEIDKYLKDKPREGMPYAISGLTDDEYNKVMTWLEQGAKYDDVPPEQTDIEKEEIKNWETFLNTDDLTHKLVARYFFEHMYVNDLYFDKDSGNYFNLVRSSTPPGEPVKPISTRYANSPIDQDFWYRLNLVEHTIVAKTHLPRDVSNNKLEIYKKILFEQPFKVTELPGYSEAERLNMLTTFTAIPPKSRYKFILHEAYYLEKATTVVPACRGAFNVSMSGEHIWFAFENPETSLLVNDQEFYDTVAPFLGQMSPMTGLADTFDSIQKRMREQLAINKLAVEKLKDNPRSSMSDIWSGDEYGAMAGYTTTRHDDNVFVSKGYVGPLASRVAVNNIATLERRYYDSTVNFDVWANIGVLLSIRADYADARMKNELNTLRFYAQEARTQILNTLFKDGSEDHNIVGLMPAQINLPSQIKYSTTDIAKEFKEKLIDHVKNSTDVHDPVYRPGDNDKESEVTKAFRFITQKAEEMSGEEPGFRNYLLPSMIIRVDSESGEPQMYTLMVNWGERHLTRLGQIFERPPVKYDHVMILEGVRTMIPNYMFHIKDTDVMEFSQLLTDADTPEKFIAVTDRWGVKRTQADFWDVFHSITEYVQRTDPENASVLDLGRYRTYSLDNMPQQQFLDPRIASPSQLAKE